MSINVKKVRILGVVHDIEDVQARTDIGSIKNNISILQNNMSTAQGNISSLKEEKVDKTSITLGQHTDGLIYIFVDGKPVGTGLSISGGGTVEPETADEITLTDGVMTILALANEPTLTDGVLTVA